MNATPSIREIEELLPWYAAGTLDPEQTAQVEAALVAHPELRHQLVLAEEEMNETIHRNETLGAPSSRALEDLFAKIDAEPARKPSLQRRFFDLGGLLADRLSPRTLGWAAMTAGLVIAVQLAFQLNPATQGTSHYSTASKQEAASGGTFLLVAFQPEATMAAIGAALAETKATIADGPRPGGLYKLRIGATALHDADIKRISDRLSANKTVFRLVIRSSD